MGVARGVGERNSEKSEPLVFGGYDRVIKLIGALYQRPRLGDRPRELNASEVTWEKGYQQEKIGRRGLPMVCLVRGGAHQGVLVELKGKLDEAKPHGVRCAYLDLGKEPPVAESSQVAAVRDTLWDARNELISNPKTRGTGLRFGLFTLVVWLMNQKLAKHDQNPDRTMRRWIQKLGLAERFRSTIQNVDDQLPADKVLWKLPLLLLRGLTSVTFRIAVTGRVPVLSGQYRWFMRQPHLAPEMSGTFVRFARRLTDEEWQKEAPEFVSRLLVNAFLEDLRRAYELRPWQFWRRRRMTYPVLLLDNITKANGGYEVLQLINEVRNQVGLFDPLLLVSASADVPPDVGDPSRPRYDAATAPEAYRAWQNALRDDRRARRDTAWYLPIRIRENEPQEVLDDADRRLKSLDGYRLDRARARQPWWAARWMRISAPLAVILLLSGFLWYQHESTLDAHCRTGIESLTWTGGECVGMSDGTFNLFQPSDAAIDQVVAIVLAQNRRAEELHAAYPERPFITLVDLEALTSSTGTADGLTAERESLEGFAVAQSRQLNAAGSADPIVRILIANGGKGMREGPKVAAKLREMATRDASIVGVVGLDMSSKPTADTITALTNAGIPMVAATLSADSLADQNPMYFQVAPQNRRQAEVVAAFANQLAGPPRTVRVYYSDDDSDVYSTNLRDDALKSFGSRGFRVEARAFTPNGFDGKSPSHERYKDQLVGNPSAAGRDTCSYDGFVFFTGRGVPDFGDFLAGAAQCESKATLLGGDDVTRFVADGRARQLNGALPYYFASLAVAPVDLPEKGTARDFYTTLSKMFTFESTPEGRSLDGHAALSYDAAKVMITAAAYLRETAAAIPVTPGTIWREIAAIHTSAPDVQQSNKVIEGVTGTIDFGGDISKHVPDGKPVSILRVSGGNVEEKRSAFCGRASETPQDAWCP